MAGKWAPRKIKSPEEMLKLFEAYSKKVKNNPILVHDFKWKDVESVMIKKERPLTIEWFYIYVEDEKNVNVEHYFSNQGDAYEDFLGVCKRIRTKVREDQISWGMAGIYNPSITQRLNGLVEKREVENSGTVKNIVTVGMPEEDDE